MTREELEEFGEILSEIKHLEEELKNPLITTDSVKGSDSEFPYTNHNIKIIGIDEKRARTVRARLERQKDKLETKVIKMENWLDTVEGSLIRDILRLTYRNNLTQNQIGAELGYDRSVISRKLKDFWEKEKERQACTQNTQ